jgi:hypothetical protein
VVTGDKAMRLGRGGGSRCQQKEASGQEFGAGGAGSKRPATKHVCYGSSGPGHGYGSCNKHGPVCYLLGFNL